MALEYTPSKALAHLHAVDPALSRLIRAVGEFTLTQPSGQTPYEALMRAIVYQQLSGKAAGTILGRVLALHPNGGEPPRPQDLETLEDTQLRGAGLSQNKTLALRDLAAKTIDGTVPKTLSALKKLSDDEIVARLTAVRGVGVWTVQMLLIFRLGRPDVLPVADLGIQKGFQLTYDTPNLPRPAELTEAAEPWRPFRSVASWYLWRATDLAKGK